MRLPSPGVAPPIRLPLLKRKIPMSELPSLLAPVRSVPMKLPCTLLPVAGSPKRMPSSLLPEMRLPWTADQVERTEDAEAILVGPGLGAGQIRAEVVALDGVVIASNEDAVPAEAVDDQPLDRAPAAAAVD